MRYIILSLFLLASCGGGGNGSTPTTPTPPPTQGTLLDEACSESTVGVKIFTYANGTGGSYTEEEDFVAECGWDQEDYDTLRTSDCDGTTLREVYGDGRGGDREVFTENSSQCFVVTMVKDEGDRFDPIVLTYEPADVEVSVEITVGPQFGPAWPHPEPPGYVQIQDGRIEITGKGWEGIVSLSVTALDAEESFEVAFRPEPRCVMQSDFSDCMGYRYSGPTKGFIYYGEEDDRIVEWDLAIMYASGKRRGFGDPYDEEYVTEETDPDLWETSQRMVDSYNTAYEISGIHVRYVLSQVVIANLSGNLDGANRAASLVDADLMIVKGISGCTGACGCAYARTSFGENTGKTPLVGVSACGKYTDLHELGHTIGLAHGPQNLSNAASGYIWSDFGHGWGSDFCGFYADIMSYGGTRISHHNSKLTCREVFGEERESISEAQLDDPSGSRDYADAAYHINRVRYDVSLIYSEYYKKSQADEEEEQSDDPAEDGILVIDHIDDIPNGLELLRIEQAQHRVLIER